MMSGRSYARIVWSRNQLSVHLVNSDGDQFTMFAQPFFSLFSKPDKLSLVKKMDKNPMEARGYHGGEIYGRIVKKEAQYKKGKDDKNLYDWVLTLYFGSLTQRVKEDDNGDPINVLTTKEFILPQDEMKSFKNCIKTMLDQSREFDRLKISADATPEWPFFNKNPGDAKE